MFLRATCYTCYRDSDIDAVKKPRAVVGIQVVVIHKQHQSSGQDQTDDDPFTSTASQPSSDQTFFAALSIEILDHSSPRADRQGYILLYTHMPCFLGGRAKLI